MSSSKYILPILYLFVWNKMNPTSKVTSNCKACQRAAGCRLIVLTCSGCNRWQHPICNTGIDTTAYQSYKQRPCDFKLKCIDCRPCPAPKLFLITSDYDGDDLRWVPKTGPVLFSQNKFFFINKESRFKLLQFFLLHFTYLF